MFLAPLVAAKTISWLVIGGYTAAGAGLSAAAIYVGNYLFSTTSNGELQQLVTAREALTNTRLEELARENQDLNIVVQDTTAANTTIHENLIAASTQAKKSATQTKITNRELQCVASTLSRLSTKLDTKSQQIISSLEHHLVKINKNLQEANEARDTTAILQIELKRLQNLSQELESTLLKLRKENGIEFKKLTQEKLDLTKALQQTNKQILFLVPENKALKTENQNLQVTVAQANDLVMQAGNQSNLHFFSR